MSIVRILQLKAQARLLLGRKSLSLLIKAGDTDIFSQLKGPFFSVLDDNSAVIPEWNKFNSCISFVN
ncbi:hypothetical protein LLO_2980 [Legionella longbeachae NSW150]|uniref:Uncharacterized protein n=1 Tax=Legionella longbeachae serogroup 1 (strain NSW150) TaxID=661367 RepID=D3HLU7_LEGLN|nr:hypothetical protein LLO_2980 [Legionella longbeachae NSW150]